MLRGAVLVGGRWHPLLLQVKEANRSVLAPYVDEATEKPQRRAGRRRSAPDAAGQRHLPRLGDRPERSRLLRPPAPRHEGVGHALADPVQVNNYAKYCGLALARAHANTGSAGAIAGYLGNGSKVDKAFAQFGVAYADQTEIDHGRLVEAIADGRVEAVDETA